MLSTPTLSLVEASVKEAGIINPISQTTKVKLEEEQVGSIAHHRPRI